MLCFVSSEYCLQTRVIRKPRDQKLVLDFVALHTGMSVPLNRQSACLSGFIFITHINLKEDSER